MLEIPVLFPCEEVRPVAAAARRVVPASCDQLARWAERTGRRRAAESDEGELLFAFYGGLSTEDYQDPVTSPAGGWARRGR